MSSSEPGVSSSEPGAGSSHPGGSAMDPGFLTVSNLLSLSRIPLGVAFLAVPDVLWLGGILIVAAATDVLDGFIARLSGTVSEVGMLLDPFCDKLFVLLGLVSFLPAAELEWAGFIILILRDIFTGGVYLVGRLAGQKVPFTSRVIGKITTALQLVTLFTLLFAPVWAPLLILAVGVASVAAIVDYGTAGIRNVQAARSV